MAKKTINFVCNFFLGLLIFLLFIRLIYYNKSVKEGVVFTPYDNAKLFTEPWNKFCIMPPPSCDKNFMYGQKIDTSRVVGCLCKGVGNAGNLDTKCNDIDYNHFY
jgi:hypothetical protein